MTKYEEAVSYAQKLGIDVIETELEANDGFYCDNTIFINAKLITDAEKYCVINEELGHYKLTVGNITNPSNVNNRKQEIKARRWGYEKTAGLSKIAEAVLNGAINKYEIAEALNITDSYFDKAIQYLKLKYGKTAYCKGIIFYFEPDFGIYKKL